MGDEWRASGKGRGSYNVVRTHRMERPVSGRCQDAGERKKDVPDATPDRRHIRSGGLRFARPVRQMHGTHGTQDIIFADEGVVHLSGGGGIREGREAGRGSTHSHLLDCPDGAGSG